MALLEVTWPYLAILVTCFMTGIGLPPLPEEVPIIGAGIAASKTPNPNIARLRSIVAHPVFGIGPYGSALLAALFEAAGLKAIRTRDALSESEQIRQAIREWLERKGGLRGTKAERKPGWDGFHPSSSFSIVPR